MRFSALVGLFFMALNGIVANPGEAFAQDDEEVLENYYNEIAAGTENSNETGDDGPVETSAPAAEPEPPTPMPEPLPESGPYDEEDASDSASEVKTGFLPNPWERGGKRRHLSLNGATGLFHIIEAGTDEQGNLGGGFHGGFFKYSDYLVNGDVHSSMWSGLNLRLVPFSFLEVFVGAQTYSNHNNLGSPKLYQTIGNVEPGLKAFFRAADWIDIAGLLGVQFKNPVGGVDLSFKGTSIDLALLTTFDFSRLNDSAPFRAHLNVGYLFDNSSNLVVDLERSRGGCGDDLDGDSTTDFVGCLDPIERKSLDINRNDQLRVGVGVDVLFPYFSPIVEYWLDIPVNRQDFVCPEDIPGSVDQCMVEAGFGGVRQWLTLGLRILPPVNSLAIDLGFDIGLTGWGPTVHELAAQDPYRFMFGLSYSFNMREKVQRIPACETEPVAQADPETVPLKAIINGFVHDKDNAEKQLAGAVVTYKGLQLSSHTTDSYGKFRSHPVPLGTVTVEVSAEGYEPGTFEISIPHPPHPGIDPGREDLADPYQIEIDHSFPMLPLAAPVTDTSSMMVRVLDEKGKPVQGAKIAFEGPTNGDELVDGDGKLKRNMDLGTYALTISKEGYLMRAKIVKIEKNSIADVEIKLVKKPAKARVIIKNKRIVIRRKIHFATGSETIMEDSYTLLDEVADVLMSNPQIKKVEIQGHTDNKGRQKYNMNLSDKRAAAVKTYLIEAGIDSSRVQSKGFGPNKPVAPNVTSNGRARNRRVEFHILKREEAPETK